MREDNIQITQWDLIFILFFVVLDLESHTH